MDKKVFKVEGMSCMHCVKSIEESVSQVKGVSGVKVSLNEKSVSIDYDSTIASEKDLLNSIESLGYEIIEA
jgi:copper chaperone